MTNTSLQTVKKAMLDTGLDVVLWSDAALTELAQAALDAALQRKFLHMEYEVIGPNSARAVAIFSNGDRDPNYVPTKDHA